MSEHILPYHAVDSQGSTKDNIIQISIKFFAEDGYRATSLDRIAAECNIRKASIFHYFPTKRVLGAAAIREIQKDSIQYIFADLTEASARKTFLKQLKQYLSQRPDTILPLALFNNISSKENEIISAIDDFIIAWNDELIKLLTLCKIKKNKKQVALRLFSQIQGVLLFQHSELYQDQLNQLDKWLLEILDAAARS